MLGLVLSAILQKPRLSAACMAGTIYFSVLSVIMASPTPTACAKLATTSSAKGDLGISNGRTSVHIQSRSLYSPSNQIAT